eukprot:scaffold6880_cov30-Tisochrysis_lutea.AAC.4
MNSPQVSLGPILPVVTNSPAALTRALLSNKFLPKRIVGEYDKCIEDTVSLNPVEADYVDIITNGGLDDDEYASVKMLLSTITIHSAQQLGAIALGRQKNKRMQTSSEATQDD